jgi:hypothetical protein
LAGQRSGGIAGSAVLVGAAGLYLVYVGIRDVPFISGLRELLRKQTPTSRETHTPFNVQDLRVGANTVIGAALDVREGDSGISKLVGNAATAYPIFRRMGNWQILGWGLRPDLSSDHPKGLAMDIMHPTPQEASAIIAQFRGLPGAKYWIWNRQIANVAVDNWRVRPYSGPSPHTDHVHLSFS